MCCELLKSHLSKTENDWDEKIIYHNEKFNEYGIIVHDGGYSVILINYCPWCGERFQESKRDLWFDLLEKLGYDDPTQQNIPEEFHSSLWYTSEKYSKYIK